MSKYNIKNATENKIYEIGYLDKGNKTGKHQSNTVISVGGYAED